MYEMSSTLFCSMWVKRWEGVCSKGAHYQSFGICSALQAMVSLIPTQLSVTYSKQRKAGQENKIGIKTMRICISTTSHVHYVKTCNEIRGSNDKLYTVVSPLILEVGGRGKGMISLKLS